MTIELPVWLKEALPPIETPHILSFKDNEFIISYEGETVATFDSVEEAYDSVSSDVDFMFDESIDGQGGELMGGMFFSAIQEGEKTSRLLLGLTDDERLSGLVHKLESFYDFHKKYEANPDDWVLAYQWLDSHPAFWVKANKDEERTWHWSTENISSIWHSVYRDDNGRVIVLMETGGHTDDLTERYHDLRLDVSAESMEGAYVALAKKVNKFFNPDGSEIPNVPYEKSALEIELEERIADLE